MLIVCETVYGAADACALLAGGVIVHVLAKEAVPQVSAADGSGLSSTVGALTASMIS